MATNLYNIPGVYPQIQDGGLRITKPALQPKVTVIGVTNKTTVDLFDPYELTRFEDISHFDLADGTPSELSRVLDEVFSAGADRVEAVVISNATGVSAGARYSALATAYELLLNHPTDIVTPAGVTIDTPLTTGSQGETRNFAWQLAEFCYQATANHDTTIGTIGVVPPITNPTGTPTLAEIGTWVAALESYDTSALGGRAFTEYDGVTDAGGDGIPDTYAFYATSDRLMPVGTPPSSAANVVTDAYNNPTDIGAYISVTAAHVRSTTALARRVYPTLGWYHHNGAGTYAGRISTLPARRAPTNVILPNSTPSRALSLAQIGRLNTARFVNVAVKSDGNKVSDAMTGAMNVSQYYRSDFVRLSTVRIVHDAINMVRAVAEPFIGKPNNATNRNALEEEVDEGLAKMQGEGSLNDYDFDLISTPAAQILGQLIVDVKLDVALEIREIPVRMALVPPGSLAE